MEKEYNFLNEKFVKEKSKMDVISGMLMVQAMCARKLMEGHNDGILELMGNISNAIEHIKDDNQ